MFRDARGWWLNLRLVGVLGGCGRHASPTFFQALRDLAALKDSGSPGEGVAERVIPGLRIPQANRYRADLGREQQDVLQGEPPESALPNVAKLWSSRTADLGAGRQLWRYRRSLNALATPPNPPSAM